MSEFRVFIEAIRKLLVESDFNTLLTVLLGVTFSSAFCGFWAGRIKERLWPHTRPGKSEDSSLSPLPPSTCEDCALRKSLEGDLQNLNRLRDALYRSDEELWRFHQTVVPKDLLNAIVASGMKVITFANLKGGVGKTTMTANVAAFLERKGHRVLLIDFDYQGSLSATVLNACGRLGGGSNADRILVDELKSSDVLDPQRALGPTLPGVTLLSAGYELNRQETRALTSWLLQFSTDDPRYALARLLAKPDMKQFKYVLIDTPPRLGLATVNALCASTHVVVPTILNGLSIANVGILLRQLDEWFRRDLNPNLRLAGILGTMTLQQPNLHDEEIVSRRSVEEMALKNWEKLSDLEVVHRTADLVHSWPENAHVLKPFVSRNIRFFEDASSNIAYLDQSAKNAQTRGVIEQIGAQILSRVQQ